MNEFDRKKHWETIYKTKELNEVSWYQPNPETSLALILNSEVPKDAHIIDVGGGDSFLVDYLLELGYSNLTVLDISEAAIERAKKRLREKAKLVNWIVSDVTKFQPTEKYDVWHDRAAFHFLTDAGDIETYKAITKKGISDNGQLILGTFSTDGPTRCSGIDIKQYSVESLKSTFEDSFEAVEEFTVDHPTPFDTVQNFVFCRFER